MTKSKIKPKFNVGDHVYYCGNILKYTVVEVLPDKQYHVKNSIAPFDSHVAAEDELITDNDGPWE